MRTTMRAMLHVAKAAATILGPVSSWFISDGAGQPGGGPDSAEDIRYGQGRFPSPGG